MENRNDYLNDNGKIIQLALRELKNPATARQVVQKIADIKGENPKDIYENVMEALEGGVHFGFIQSKNGKYFIDTFGPQDLLNRQSRPANPSDLLALPGSARGSTRPARAPFRRRTARGPIRRKGPKVRRLGLASRRRHFKSRPKKRSRFSPKRRK